jgi:hypothetical protein
MRGPIPAAFIRGTANGHAAEPDDFEFTFLECANLIGPLESLQNHFQHRISSFHNYNPQTHQDRIQLTNPRAG